MQSYDNKPKEQGFGKKIILEFLDFLKFKIENDALTAGELESLARMVMENANLYVTIDELSAYYGKSKDAVNSVIKRRMIQKPRRNVVLYSLSAFRKILPSSWREKH